MGTQAQYYNLQIHGPETTFATQETETWLDCPIRERFDDSDLVNEWLLDTSSIGDDDGEHPEIQGSRANRRITIPTYAMGLGGSGLGDGESHTEDAIDKILHNYINSAQAFATNGDTVATGTGATTGFDFTTQTGLSHAVAVLGVETPTNGTQWRPYVISGGTAIALIELPEAPANGATIWGSQTYRWAGNVATDAHSFATRIITEDDNFLMLGCATDTLTLTLPTTQLGTLDLECVVADWNDDEIATPAAQTPWAVSPHMNAHAIIQQAGVTTWNAANARALRSDTVFSTTRNLQPRRNPHNAQGLDAWFAPGTHGTTITTVHDTGETWRDAKVAGTQYQMMIQTTRTPGGVFGFYEEKLQIKGEPVRGVTDEMLTQSITWGRVTDTLSRTCIFRG